MKRRISFTALLLAAAITAAVVVTACGGNRNKGADTANDSTAETAAAEEETDFFVFDFEGGMANPPQAVSLNEMSEQIEYIPLETHPDALLLDYYTLARVGGDFFINTSRPAWPNPQPIYRFDSLGRFVKQETYIGRGENEVWLPVAWHANANLRQINVVNLGSHMVVTSTESGERFSVGVDMRRGLENIPLNDSTFVSIVGKHSGVPAKYLFFADRKGEVIHTVERSDKLAEYVYELSEGEGTPISEKYRLWSHYAGDAIFSDIFNDTLYRIRSHREITPHVVFRRGKLSPRREDTYNAANKRRQAYFWGFIESGDHVFLSYQLEGKVWRDVWSKHDGRLLTHYAPEGVTYPFNLFVPFALPDGGVIDLQVVYADKERVYGMMGALDACRFLPDVKEDDNPVIVVAKLKK